MRRTPEPGDDEGDGGGPMALPSLAETLLVLRKRAGLIAGLTLLCAGLATALAQTLTPVYEATATVFVDSRDKKITEMDSVVEGMKTDTPTIESEVEIARSPQIAERVISELGLDEDAELAGGAPGLGRLLRNLAWLVLGKAAAPAPAKPAGEAASLEHSQALAGFLDRLSTDRVRNTYLIAIRFESKDAEKAARIANATANAYVAEQVEAKIKVAELASAWLERRIGELRERLFDAERRVEEFKAKNSIVDAEGFTLDEKQLARAMESLILARAETASAKAKFAQARSLSDDGKDYENVSDVLQSPTIAGLKDRYAKTTQAVAELSTRYGPKHPSMVKAEAEMRDARFQLAAEIRKVVTSLENEYRVAEGREASLKASLDAAKAGAGATGQASVALRELQREASAAREIYETFRKRVEETHQQQSLQLADSRVIAQASVPTSPSGSKRMQVIALGTGLGLVLGLGLTVLLELVWPSVYRPEAIERDLDLKHLASLPAAAPLAPGSDGPGLEDALAQVRRIVVEPQSGFAEAIRELRVEIDGRRSEGRSEVVLVASAMPGEGKSVVASNLAHHYALSGVRTLLIDCDLRRASLTRSLVPGAEGGLLECLIERLPVGPAILREAATGLSFLPAASEGAPAAAAAELLSSRFMARALAEMQAEFEMIVLDSPPLMPVVDARILADLASQIVLVYRHGKTPRVLARRALKHLEGNGDKLAGIVVNGVDPALLRGAEYGYAAYAA